LLLDPIILTDKNNESISFAEFLLDKKLVGEDIALLKTVITEAAIKDRIPFVQVVEVLSALNNHYMNN